MPPRHVVSIFVLKILVEHDYKDSMRPDYESLSKRDRNHFSFFRNHRKPVPRIRGDAIIAYASARVRVCKGVCVCVRQRTHMAEHVLSRLLPTFNLIHLAVTSIMAK